jgi:hypothetical protein
MAGRINKCGLLFTAQLQLSSYRDCGDFAVTKLEGEDLILGMPWLARIDPLILWKKRTLHFVHAGQEHIITETDTQQKRVCHVMSAVQFVRQIKKKNPVCHFKGGPVPTVRQCHFKGGENAMFGLQLRIFSVGYPSLPFEH